MNRVPEKQLTATEGTDKCRGKAIGISYTRILFLSYFPALYLERFRRLGRPARCHCGDI